MIGHALALAPRRAARAIASYVVPSTGSVLALAPANWCTALGALCFFIGAMILLRRKPDTPQAAARPLVSQEV